MAEQKGDPRGEKTMLYSHAEGSLDTARTILSEILQDSSREGEAVDRVKHLAVQLERKLTEVQGVLGSLNPTEDTENREMFSHIVLLRESAENLQQAVKRVDLKAKELAEMERKISRLVGSEQTADDQRKKARKRKEGRREKSRRGSEGGDEGVSSKDRTRQRKADRVAKAGAMEAPPDDLPVVDVVAPEVAEAPSEAPEDRESERENPEPGQKIYLSPKPEDAGASYQEVEFVRLIDDGETFVIRFAPGGKEIPLTRHAFFKEPPDGVSVVSEFEGSEYYVSPLEQLGLNEKQLVYVPAALNRKSPREMQVLGVDAGKVVVWTGGYKDGKKLTLRFSREEIQTERPKGRVESFREAKQFTPGQTVFIEVIGGPDQGKWREGRVEEQKGRRVEIWFGSFLNGEKHKTSRLLEAEVYEQAPEGVEVIAFSEQTRASQPPQAPSERPKKREQQPAVEAPEESPRSVSLEQLALLQPGDIILHKGNEHEVVAVHLKEGKADRMQVRKLENNSTYALSSDPTLKALELPPATLRALEERRASLSEVSEVPDPAAPEAPEAPEAVGEKSTEQIIHDWIAAQDLIPGLSDKILERRNSYVIVDGSELTLARFLDQFSDSHRDDMMNMARQGVIFVGVIAAWLQMPGWDREKLKKSLEGSSWLQYLEGDSQPEAEAEAVDEADDEEAEIEEAEELERELQDMTDEEVVREFLTYNDVLERAPEDIAVGPSELRYVEAFRRVYENEVYDDVYDRIRQRFDHAMDALGLEPSEFGESESWIHWDMAKQEYYHTHRDKADTEHYIIDDPLENQDVQDEIADRQLGWELYDAVQRDGDGNAVLDRFGFEQNSDFENLQRFLNLSPENGKYPISSWQLTKIGELAHKLLLDHQLSEVRGADEAEEAEEVAEQASDFQFEGEPVAVGERFSFDIGDGREPIVFQIEDIFEQEDGVWVLRAKSEQNGNIRNFPLKEWNIFVNLSTGKKLEAEEAPEAAEDQEEDGELLEDEEVQEVVDFGGREFVIGDTLIWQMPDAARVRVVVRRLNEADNTLIVGSANGSVEFPIDEAHLQYLQEKGAAPQGAPARAEARPQPPAEASPQPREAPQPAEAAPATRVESLKSEIGAEQLQHLFTKFGTETPEQGEAIRAIESYIQGLEGKTDEEKERMAELLQRCLALMTASAHKRYLHLHEHFDRFEPEPHTSKEAPESFGGRVWSKVLGIGKSMKRQWKQLSLSGGMGLATGLLVSSAVAASPLWVGAVAGTAGKATWNLLKRNKWDAERTQKLSDAETQERVNQETWETFERDEAPLAADRMAYMLEAIVDQGLTDENEIQEYVFQKLIESTGQRREESDEAKNQWRSLKLEQKAWQRDQLIKPELAYTNLVQQATNRSQFFTENWKILANGYESVAGGSFGVLSVEKKRAMAGAVISSIAAGTAAAAVMASAPGGFFAKFFTRGAVGFGFGAFEGARKKHLVVGESAKLRSADVALKRGGNTDHIDANIDTIDLSNNNRVAKAVAGGLYGAGLGATFGAAMDAARGALVDMPHEVGERGAATVPEKHASVPEDVPAKPEAVVPVVPEAAKPVSFVPGGRVEIGGHELLIGKENALIDLPSGLMTDAKGNTLLGTTEIGRGHGSEWGALKRLSEQYGNFGKSNAELAGWIKSELRNHGFVFKDGAVGRPWTVHPSMKVELFFDAKGEPHVNFVGEEGKDFTPYKFVKFQETVSIPQEVASVSETSPQNDVPVKEVYQSLYGKDVAVKVPEGTMAHMERVGGLPEVHTEGMSQSGGREIYFARDAGQSYVYVKDADGSYLRTSYDDFFKGIPDANKGALAAKGVPADIAQDLAHIARERQEFVADKAKFEAIKAASAETKAPIPPARVEKRWVNSDIPVKGAGVHDRSGFVETKAAPVVPETAKAAVVPEAVVEAKSLPIRERFIAMTRGLNQMKVAGTDIKSLDYMRNILLDQTYKTVADPSEQNAIAFSKFLEAEAASDPEMALMLESVNKDKPFAVSNPPSHGIKMFRDGESFLLYDKGLKFGETSEGEPAVIGKSGEINLLLPIKDFQVRSDGQVIYFVEKDGETLQLNPREPLSSS